MPEHRRSPARLRSGAGLAAVAAAVLAVSACAANPNATSATSAPTTTAAQATTSASTAAGSSAGSSSAGSSASGESSAAGGEKLTSAQFINPLPQYPAWRTIGDCMAQRAEERGIDFTESGPSGSGLDATVMVQQVQQAIANAKGAVITFPASDGFAPVLQQAQAAGIITATMYGGGGADSGADVNIGVDWGALGKMYVEAIAEREGPQKVGLIAQAPTGTGKAWMDGVKAAAAETDNVTVVGEVYTGDDAAKALDQSNALLTAHPDVNVIATHMGTVTPGAVAAIKSKGLLGKVVLVGNGPDNGGKEALADGSAYRILLQGLCQEGKDALDAVADLANDQTVAPQIDTQTIMAGDDDLEKLLGEGWG
ncbi:substrate-binding domain-containing protein [Nakamurella sp. YIM 132087]|uniref:Substrate-binding domain-containing protein n=1 Tax=Nakamurella alba TaxID=2665158 RepID=A0A7K1FS11_9ACTN|nr:sugar ABC transporter substrate-binding protein [Nakamurella alba]MTD16860.1 substrate-binding domain-containing protein [Nakamurella alba]